MHILWDHPYIAAVSPEYSERDRELLRPPYHNSNSCPLQKPQ